MRGPGLGPNGPLGKTGLGLNSILQELTLSIQNIQILPENDDTECPTKLLTSEQINMLEPLQPAPEEHEIHLKTIDEIILANTKGISFGCQKAIFAAVWVGVVVFYDCQLR